MTGRAAAPGLLSLKDKQRIMDTPSAQHLCEAKTIRQHLVSHRAASASPGFSLCSFYQLLVIILLPLGFTASPT